MRQEACVPADSPQIDPLMTAPVAESEPKASREPSVEDVLAQVEKVLGERRSYDQVAEAAQPFLAALAMRRIPADRIWVICPHVRLQEVLHHDLAIWGVRSRFFPEVEFSGFEEALPDPDVGAERLSILTAAASRSESGSGDRLVMVLCEESLDDLVPTPKRLKMNRFELTVGDRLDLMEFIGKLEAVGYDRTTQVFARGQYAVRGGIVDVFTWQSDLPLRIELFDDEIESIREFDVDDQGSVSRVRSASLLLEMSGKEEHCRMRDYVSRSDAVIAVDCEPDLEAEMIRIDSQVRGRDGEEAATACLANPLGSFEAGDFILQEAKRDQFRAQLRQWEAEDWTVAMFFNTEGELERFRELVDRDFLEAGTIRPLFGRLGRGFTVPAARVALLSDSEIFGRYQNLRSRRLAERRMKQRRVRSEDDLRRFEEGDLVVHQEYGLGRFLEIVERDGQEVLVLEYADKARLYVPLELGHLVSRYVGTGKGRPELTKLGGNRWNRTREKAERSIMDYAAELLAIQAERTREKTYAHEPDTKWQWEFEHSFLYRETPDQLAAIEATKRDMEEPQPMDRLICGDVGFGKTEVAIRAAFKAVMSGRQVAVLVPTTVLAQQHFQTFRERMSDYPVTIDLLSRYRTSGQQRKTLVDVANGTVDIVIGTHRLISQDVHFKRLGLVVIDEEQRFGVRHKERFKELFRMVDVLTLSATPIPRTLYMSLMGVKDMSTIDTPPANRIPVATSIIPYDERVMRMAIDRELHRQGQVFYLHNRVQSIGAVKEKIEKLCPDARVEFGHGQMEEKDLEDVMNRFVNHEFDVLVATTIIESGIDIPNANTIIIDRADRFGLADLYQLRGRVGRATQKAYAILMIPRDLMTVGDARKRIEAIKQYTALGSGFRIAMRDLEIRGAGNLLGTQQSGHIAAVGFDLYCRLLKQSIAKLRGETSPRTIEVVMNLDFVSTSEADFARNPDGVLPAFLPAAYMEEAQHRIQAYRELAEIGTLKELRAIRRNWEDRFGRLPDPVENLLRCTELKCRAAQKGVGVVEVKGDKLILNRRGQGMQIDGKYPRLQTATLPDRLSEAVEWIKRL